MTDNTKNVVEEMVEQMARNHAIEIDKNFWLVVNKKPKWMPSFLYRAVIKNLVSFRKHNA